MTEDSIGKDLVIFCMFCMFIVMYAYCLVELKRIPNLAFEF